MSKLTARSITAEILAMELGNETRWQGDKIGGAPTPGLSGLNLGLLPEPYHVAAGDATYAVYHHETPIAWKTAAGIWYVPQHHYSQTTSTFRNRIVGALGTIDADFELI